MNLYTERIGTYQDLLKQESAKSTRTGAFRLLAALLTGLSIYVYYHFDNAYAILTILLGGTVFFYLINKHRTIKKKIALYRELIHINEREICALQGDLSAFPAGDEYLETEHPYTHDLDIFGQNSLFQSINRTSTAIGRNKLAHLFKTQRQEDILTNQQAIQELAQKIDWRQHFTAKGNLNPDDKNSIQHIHHWITDASYFQTKKIYRKFAYLLPAILYFFAAAYLITDENIYYQG
ncbi:MAG TPA: hypothetical protein VK750_01515, partial [Cytophagaceae bacterium]|nr:hypothetical protein [Cytophagaceae bacterium]